MIQTNILKDCWKGNHDLKSILRASFDQESEHVVRWCGVCGAVVLDVDIDGRTSPGAAEKMIGPIFSSKGHWQGGESDKRIEE